MLCDKCKKKTIKVITSDNELKYICFCDKNNVIKKENLVFRSLEDIKESNQNKVKELKTKKNKIMGEMKNAVSDKTIERKRKELESLDEEIDLLSDKYL